MSSDQASRRALLIDLEGTLHMGDETVQGAPAAIQSLRDSGIPHAFITNTTRYSRAELAFRLRSMGFPLEEKQLVTAPRAASAWLRQRGIRRVMLCVPESTRADFTEFSDSGSGAEVEAVVVGDLGREWTFDRLNAAFRALMGGAALVALQKNRYWKTKDGLVLDAGPFVSALEHAASTRAIVVGKPSRDFFSQAAAFLETDAARIWVVGDDVEADVGGAQQAGMRGALVRTGKFSEEAVRSSGIVPDDIAGSLPELVERWFGR